MRSLIPRRPKLSKTGRWLASLAFAMALLAVPAWLARKPHTAWERVAGEIGEVLRDASVRSGLVVAAVEVVGLRRTARRELLQALGLEVGDSILAIDLDAARARIESLPWVATARLSRVLPDRITVSVTEQTPLALWQVEGRLRLIDPDGVLIGTVDLSQFPDLPIVVGPGAETHAAGLLAMLDGEPELARQVRGATWVGGRRWNLYLGNDMVVKLPEQDPAAAWAVLAELEREHRILARSINVIDLRLPGRVSVRIPGKSPGGTGYGLG
ncbi:MAG: FtsQ-type POTRA domain-containing protein [Alphaproteobacteria bacterium]|nr:FtsQ-type POTRA domain-containing protein [Alphaproteobacteria bacterium]